MSTISSGTDFATKYQKLASEFAKLRVQVPVLKKAVLDEQENSSKLRETVGEKEKELRKQESEIQSLVFRNQQLAKRVEVLQDNLTQLSSPKASKKIKNEQFPRSQSSFVIGSSDSVLQEELASKLAENAKLHTQIFEIRASQEENLKGIENKVNVLEIENASLQKELDSIKNRHQAVLSEVRSEKSALEQGLNSLKAEFDAYKWKFDQLNESSCKELGVASRMLSGRLAFNDSEESTLNKLNVVPTEKCLFSQISETFESVKSTFVQIFTAYGNFTSYMDQRSQLYPCDSSMENVTGINLQLSQSLKQASTSLKSLSNCVIRLCNECQTDTSHLTNNIGTVISCFEDFVTSWKQNVIPVFLKSIDEECAVSWCNNRLEKENIEWKACLMLFVDSCEEFSNRICSLMTLDSEESAPLIVDDIYLGLRKISKCASDLSTQYSAKVMCEHQLPTATKRLRTTNECLLASLHTLAKQFNSLTQTLEQGKEMMVSFLVRSFNSMPGTQELLSQADEYLDSVSDLTSSIPAVSSGYNLSAVINTNNTDELKCLQVELEKKKKRLAEFEREREHWTLEIQLMKVKYSTASKSSTTDMKQIAEDTNDKGIEDAIINDEHPSHDVKVVEEHYGAKLEYLVCQLQSVESRASYFQQECGQLLRTVQGSQRQREKLQKDLKESSVEITKLKDEMETTREGYEKQMSSLSEHLAQMNQTLARQTDEIDMLRQAVAQKSNHKKSRFK